MSPTIALPEARKYFQKQLLAGQIQLPTHYILVKEALTVLGGEGQRELLKQLLWGEFNDAIVSAQESQSPWLMKNLNADGWIDLSEELLFQSINRAMAGILTIVATLPWQIQQQTYQMLGKAKDATFELMDSVMTTRNASCLAEFSLRCGELCAFLLFLEENGRVLMKLYKIAVPTEIN